MNRGIFRSVTAVLVFFTVSIAHARLSAYFSYATFDQPGHKPYIETYLQVTGTSVNFAPIGKDRYVGTLEVQWVWKKKDSIVTFDKYLLHSPEMDSLGLNSPADFLDLQRTALDTGDYSVELTITDRHSDEPAVTIRQDIAIRFPHDAVSISDIELLERYAPTKKDSKFTKSGFDVYPYVLGFYPAEVRRLLFYTEIYRTEAFAGTDVLIRYMISNNESKQLINELIASKKQAAADVIPLMAELPIDQLPSGNYQLTIEVRSRDNRLMAIRQSLFQRINPINRPARLEDISAVDANSTFAARYTELDTIKEHVASLLPMLSPLEGQIAENQLLFGTVNSLQQFLYYYWSRKDPVNPQGAWDAYHAEVLKVNSAYSTLNRKGYETERGRIYLRYGPPNTIVKDYQDPESYPYEIWHYYKINGQTNRKFVFYAPDMVANSFRLLHSDVRGEIQDPNWELKLHSRSQAFGADIDQDQSYDIYGSRTKENFRLPR